LEKVLQPGDDVIDVGTGSGILSIAAAKLGAKHVLAVDLDPVAVTSALDNTKQNQLEEQITVKLSDLLGVLKESESEGDAGLGVSIPVQLVVANILAEVIVMFVDDVYEVLQQGGYYITSGIITNKEADVEKALVAAKFTIVEKNYDSNWVVIVARKL
jgi:ribosomal protein L11 methyltransferase